MNPTDPAYWQKVYDEEASPGWDMDEATPVLAEILGIAASLELEIGEEIAVPGCGFGHDAAELARRGFRVMAMDFAPAAIAGAKARYGDSVAWRQEDWFSAKVRPFDAIFDHTCFVAMDPSRRGEYLSVCESRLKLGGLWLAVCFDDTRGKGNPPFEISMEDARILVADHFDLLHLARAEQSHPRRAGREFLLIAQKKREISRLFVFHPR